VLKQVAFLPKSSLEASGQQKNEVECIVSELCRMDLFDFIEKASNIETALWVGLFS
jgi:hypothetical protein